ncbi:putative addiction module component (TIGR02574 family) [Thiogranum longum]|uniref:Putative addiction module component (TIGR02574 family) n=1 Tax=Thiogranum longum TaxID=1537524 RepID=A0A4R1HBQ9_9GAMM|nr:addiction module protein [Thiogranum longum]TCK17655.1 putative addiction module component (TIGR02574 family) [Thiogranum longum]
MHMPFMVCYYYRMATSARELYQQAMELEDEERASLAGLLLESLDTEVEEGVEAAWLEEIERRMAALDSGDAKLVPWEDVRNRLLKRLDAAENS